MRGLVRLIVRSLGCFASNIGSPCPAPAWLRRSISCFAATIAARSPLFFPISSSPDRVARKNVRDKRARLCVEPPVHSSLYPMKPKLHLLGVSVRHLAQLALLLTCAPVVLLAADRKSKPPSNHIGAPVLDAKSRPINYSRARLAALALTKRQGLPSPPRRVFLRPQKPASNRSGSTLFSALGSAQSNIIICPTPTDGSAPPVLIGGNSLDDFGADDFWQAIQHNPTTGNYDQLFVSPIYSATIARIGLANVLGDSNPEIL